MTLRLADPFVRPLLLTAMAVLLSTAVVSAHLQVNTPNGAEVFTVGDQVTIEWKILIAHDTANWDLWYSTTGGGGPWIPLATDLPPGNIAVNTIHTYVWTVPAAAVSSQVRILARMDNIIDSDYYDTSNADFTVQAATWIDLENGLAGTNGIPSLNGTGTLVGGTALTLTLTDAKESATAYLVVGFATLNAPFKGGVLVPDLNAPGFVIALPTDGSGGIVIPATWPTGLPSGFSSYFQYWIQDAVGPVGFSASNALEGVSG